MLRLSDHAIKMMEQRLRIENNAHIKQIKLSIIYITNTSFNIFFSRKEEEKHKECLCRHPLCFYIPYNILTTFKLAVIAPAMVVTCPTPPIIL